MCSAYMFDIFIGDIASTAIFQKNKKSMYYILRFIHEMPNTHTLDLTLMVILSFYPIFVEYPIYCNFNTIPIALSISPVIVQTLNHCAYTC